MSTFRIFAKDSGRYLGQVDAVDEASARATFSADHPKIEVDVALEDDRHAGSFAPYSGPNALGNSAMSSSPSEPTKTGNRSQSALFAIWLTSGILGFVIVLIGLANLAGDTPIFPAAGVELVAQIAWGAGLLVLAIVALVGHLVVNAVVRALDQRR